LKNHHLLLYLFLIIPLGTLIAIAPEKSIPGFFADEAVYLSMTMSLANDADLSWTRKDLENVCEIFPSGPVGVILRKNVDGSVVYAKPFIFPLFATLFYLLLGIRGILVLNVLCVWLILRWLSIHWGNSVSSVCFAAGALSFSAFLPYTLWFHPEIFTAFLISGFCYYWIDLSKSTSRNSLIGMAVCLSLATAIKPPLVLLGFPAAWTLIKKRKARGLIIFILVLLTVICLSVIWTGQINPYGGNRKIFLTQYPLDSGIDVFGKGNKWSTENAGFHFSLNVFLWNLLYFWIGKFSGIIWYFFPGVVTGFLALKQRDNPMGHQLMLMFIIIVIIQIILIPANYHGGGGALGNRLFVNFYPLLLFALPCLPKKRIMIGVLVFSAIFSSSFLIRPWISSYKPGEFTKSGLYNLFPVEWTLTGAFPIFEAEFYHVELPNLNGHIYFLDRQTRGLENQGFRVVEGSSCKFIIELSAPVKNINFFLTSNNLMSGIIQADSEPTEFITGPKSTTPVQLELGKGHHRKNIYGEDKWIYLINCTVKTEATQGITETNGKPAVFFQTFPPAPETKIGHKQKKGIHSMIRLREEKGDI